MNTKAILLLLINLILFSRLTDAGSLENLSDRRMKSLRFNSSKGESGFDDQYFSIFLTGGIRPSKLDETTIVLDYTDDSPSRDRIVTAKEFDEMSSAFDLELGLSFGHHKKLHHELVFGYQPGEVDRLYGGYGIGKNLSFMKNRVIIRPVVGLFYGATRFRIGELENNGVFIQVNDSRFFDESITVRMVSFQLFSNAKVEGSIRLSEEFALTTSVGYQVLISSGKAVLVFTGDQAGDDQETRKREEVELNNTNVGGLFQDGQSFDTLPVSINGLYVSFGVSWFPF